MLTNTQKTVIARNICKYLCALNFIEWARYREMFFLHRITVVSLYIDHNYVESLNLKVVA